MLRFRLTRLIEEVEFREKRRLTLIEISEKTGIYRTTLSRISGPAPFNTTTDNIDRLCRFFGCSVADLVEYVPDEISGTSNV